MVYTAVSPDYCDTEVKIIVQQALSAVNFFEKACREHIIYPVFVARVYPGEGGGGRDAGGDGAVVSPREGPLHDWPIMSPCLSHRDALVF